jgi:serine/threonine protein kinase
MEIESDYEIIKYLDWGVSAVVFLAFNKRLKEYHALKILRLSNEKNIKKLKEEFEFIINLNHKNVIKVYEVLANSEISYGKKKMNASFLALEFAKGGSFLEVLNNSYKINKKKFISEEMVRYFFL